MLCILHVVLSWLINRQDLPNVSKLNVLLFQQERFDQVAPSLFVVAPILQSMIALRSK